MTACIVLAKGGETNGLTSCIFLCKSCFHARVQMVRHPTPAAASLRVCVAPSSPCGSPCRRRRLPRRPQQSPPARSHQPGRTRAGSSGSGSQLRWTGTQGQAGASERVPGCQATGACAGAPDNAAGLCRLCRRSPRPASSPPAQQRAGVPVTRATGWVRTSVGGARLGERGGERDNSRWQLQLLLLLLSAVVSGVACQAHSHSVKAPLLQAAGVEVKGEAPGKRDPRSMQSLEELCG